MRSRANLRGERVPAFQGVANTVQHSEPELIEAQIFGINNGYAPGVEMEGQEITGSGHEPLQVPVFEYLHMGPYLAPYHKMFVGLCTDGDASLSIIHLSILYCIRPSIHDSGSI